MAPRRAGGRDFAPSGPRLSAPLAPLRPCWIFRLPPLFENQPVSPGGRETADRLEPFGMLKKRLTLASVFFTFFIDNLCWAIVFPIFAPYFLDPENKLFTPDVSIAERTTMLGFFLMAFSLGQFF